jgi:hypothetical protein
MPHDRELNEVNELARRYAELAQADRREDKPEAKGIVATMAKLGPIEVAYFCQQVISYYADVHKATMALTIFTNRLVDVIDT